MFSERLFRIAATTALVLAMGGCTSLTPDVYESAGQAAAPMTITTGLQDYQVLQRDESDRGSILCRGTCQQDGDVVARVLSEGKSPQKLDGHRVGEAKGGAWSARIRDIPVGGPYRIELKIVGPPGDVLGATARGNVLVGDLWILAGQSNMQGRGAMIGVATPSPWVHCYGMNEKWSIASEPLHWLRESPDPVHHRGAPRKELENARKGVRPKVARGAGLGLPFAKELHARTGVPIGLVPCAHGGTSMAQWDPAKKDLGGESLYGSMLRRFTAVGGRVTGILWYQGEAETRPDSKPQEYRDGLERFIASVRSDCDDPNLPFYLVQISRTTNRASAQGWMSVRENQRLIGREMPGVVTVSAIDLDLDDRIHIGTSGLKRLGRRLAVVADCELFGNDTAATGPQLKSAAVEDAVWGGYRVARGAVRVTFDNVNGQLKPDCHIAGFSLRADDGTEGPELFDVMVDPQKQNSILCLMGKSIPLGMNLWYGYGLNPYCNAVDELDMGVLAFGPVPLEPATATTQRGE